MFALIPAAVRQKEKPDEYPAGPTSEVGHHAELIDLL